MPEQKVAVVTGATAGLGRFIAFGLARAGFHVVLVARNAGRAEETRGWIAGLARGASTEFVLADLSSLAQTAEAAADIAARHPRIDLLVNNAGIMASTRQNTAEGHELILAVNHLSPFVLTSGLEAALRAGAPARVVNVGSRASDRARLDLDDLELRAGWGGMRAYCRSKLALMMATFERARRLDGTGVAVNVVHPGVVRTDLGSQPGLMGLGWNAIKPFMITPEQGADTPLHVALSPALADVTGTYFKRRLPAAPNPQACDRAVTARLWSETLRLVG